ncbi:hypothetical protein C8R45DRAFT_387482 [Mycena sanguinolenta]|nr:hypothetical protein C8R45DRAFT_387482 [Mycena sanguinolenta]
MDVDSPLPKLEPEYSTEAQYSHIQSPDFLPLGSSSTTRPLAFPFDNAPSQDYFMSSASPAFAPFIASQIDPPSPTRADTDMSSPPASPSFDAILRTPADFSLSSNAFQGAVTPFGKGFELSDDWIPSGSYISPVIRASSHAKAKQPPLKLFHRPAISFVDRLKASSSPSTVPPLAKHNTSSSSILLSPCKLTAVSARKENHPSFQPQHIPADLFSMVSSPLTSSPLSRFHPKFQAESISPRRQAHSLFPLSPLTPLTPSPQKSTSRDIRESMPPAKPKKRPLSVSISESPTTRAKRPRYNPRPENSTAGKRTQAGTAPIWSSRTLPPRFVVSSDFPLFYRRFPASAYFQAVESESPCALFGAEYPGGEYKAPRGAFDLYSARFVKGKGVDKMGLCPICIEPKQRGGEGKKVWLPMKFSAYKYVSRTLFRGWLMFPSYHMQFQHGISAASGRPLLPPIAFRVAPRPAATKLERTEMKQGKCHKCLCWVDIETVKNVEVKVPEMFWWKHVASCHAGSVLAGEEEDVFEEDEVYGALKGL